MPEESTSFSREGTLAHSMAEVMLRYYRDHLCDRVMDFEDFKALPWDRLGREIVEISSECHKDGLDFWEMYQTVHDGYVRLVFEEYLAAKEQDPDAVLLIEEELRLSEYIPEGFGTSDSIIIWGNTVEVNDLKYGKGVKVDADHNEQMMCYALGALCGPCELYDIDNVQMTILQPRLHHVSTCNLTAAELLVWAANELQPAAQKAFNGEGPYVPGNHCHFCKVAPICRALKAKAMVTATADDPKLLDINELAETIKELDSIKRWVKRVEDYALDLALNGTVLPGFKVVEGRSLSVIKDQPAAIARLIKAGFDPSDICKPQELKTITDLKKLLRTAAFNDLLGEFVVKPQGKPTLAPESDPRPEFNSASNDFNDINV